MQRQQVFGYTTEELKLLIEPMAANGYEPRLRDDELVLANCPFDALAQEHTELVCGLNQAYIAGVLDGLGCADLEASLDPEPGLCCVKTRRRAAP